MNIIVQSKTIKLTKAIQAFCRDQSQKLFGKGSRISQITIFLEDISRKKSSNKRASAKLHIAIPGKDVVIRRQAHDLYKAVMDATDRAGRMLRKAKEKKKSRLLLIDPQSLIEVSSMHATS